MTTQPLGRTGFNASRIGIGDIADRSIPLEDCVRTLHRAIDFGLNLIDTAPGYESGYSEEIVGAALKGRRDGMFVIDKVDSLLEPVAPQVDASLKALRVDHTDMFAFHAVSEMEAWKNLAAPGGGMDQLQDCVNAGKTRFRGISSHSPEVLLAALGSSLCDVVMFPVGPFVDPRYIELVLPMARQMQIGTVCFKTFGAGKLLGNTAGYSQPLQERPRGKFSSGGSESGTESELPHMSVAECLHYTLSIGPDVALLGMSFPNEQDSVMEALQSFAPLPADELSDIRARAKASIEGKGRCWWNPQ
ncbi:MAG: aldo/keto reductase [Verrucomicrobiota bacterium]